MCPFYPFPEEAVAALSLAADYAERCAADRGEECQVASYRKEREKAESLVKMKLSATTQRPVWLNTNEISALLDCYGIRMAKTLECFDARRSRRYGSRVGFPVVLKLSSSTITHNSDVRGAWS